MSQQRIIALLALVASLAGVFTLPVLDRDEARFAQAKDATTAASGRLARRHRDAAADVETDSYSNTAPHSAAHAPTDLPTDVNPDANGGLVIERPSNGGSWCSSSSGQSQSGTVSGSASTVFSALSSSITRCIRCSTDVRVATNKFPEISKNKFHLGMARVPRRGVTRPYD